MKNKSLKKITIMMSLTLLCSISVDAQHNHGSHGIAHTTHVAQPPHGGIIKESGKYKIEMVAELFLKKDQLRFYLFKGNFKPILNQGVSGTITIKSSDGKIVEQVLQARGDDFFVAQLNNSGLSQATVNFIIKGKPISKVFSIKGYGNNEIKEKKEDTHTGHSH